jgi:sugar phosphate isomerase/epimerase
MMIRPLPTLGAAMPSQLLPELHDWLLEGQRDLEIQDAIRPELLDGDWRNLARRIRDMLDGYTGRMGIHGPFLGLTLLGYDPKIRAVVVERLKQGLAFAAEIGATHMVLHSPFIFFGANVFLPHAPAFRQQEDIDLIHATLDEVLPIAAQANVMLVIETIQDTNPGPLLALVRSFESDHVRMSLDTGHAFINHRAGGPPPDQWVREAGPLLGHVHLQDTDGNVDRHWAPGEGNLNWYALFEALAELEHNPRLILELREPRKVRQAAEYLKGRGLAV